jgi:hypothetical protein
MQEELQRFSNRLLEARGLVSIERGLASLERGLVSIERGFTSKENRIDTQVVREV